jgi:D-alanine-D-alanine ligase
MSAKKNVVVLFGGRSSEHEVSRVSAESILNNIDRDSFDVTMIGITKDGRWLKYDGSINHIGNGEWQKIAEESATSKIYEISEMSAKNFINKVAGLEIEGVDVIFSIIHGNNGEDGTLQGFFELAEIPYVGPGVLGSALGMDKVYAKMVFVLYQKRDKT